MSMKFLSFFLSHLALSFGYKHATINLHVILTMMIIVIVGKVSDWPWHFTHFRWSCLFFSFFLFLFLIQWTFESVWRNQRKRCYSILWINYYQNTGLSHHAYGLLSLSSCFCGGEKWSGALQMLGPDWNSGKILSLFRTVISIIHQMKKNYKAFFFFKFVEILTYYFH
jgi:hypothetical protein